MVLATFMYLLKLSPEILPFSLDLCLNSGQSFAWMDKKRWCCGSIRQTGFLLQQTDQGIRYLSTKSSSESSQILKNYFALTEDYHPIFQQFPDDPFLQESIRFCKGLRILRQDPWECLAGFILSSTKRIVHIQQIWQKLCLQWGNPLVFPAFRNSISSRSFELPLIHSFPEPEKIAAQSETALRACGMGFRAPYLLAAAKEIASHRLDLPMLRTLPTDEARLRLMQLKGVGRKIADCVLLFSLEKWDAFPMDTWILKVLKKVYFRKKRVTYKHLSFFTANHFGKYGGLAQQYLFHYARMNPQILDKEFTL